jgi:hypothetical protein
VTFVTNKGDGGHSLSISLSLVSGQVDVGSLLLEAVEGIDATERGFESLKTVDGFRAMVASRFDTGAGETHRGARC